MQKDFNGILTVPFFILLLLVTGVAAAQVNSVSPYSKLGLGEYYPKTYSRSQGFAGASTGLYDQLNVNFSNPASYSALELTTFEIGFEASLIEQIQANPDVTQQNGNAGLRYFAFGVPLTDWWGSAIGIQPYSFKGYDIYATRTFEDTITVTDRFTGTGGLNQLYWGNAFEVARGLSIGINAAFVFGKVEESRYVIWDESRFMNTKVEDFASVKGLYLNYGVQYRYPFADGRELGLGFTYANSMDLNAGVGHYTYTYTGNVGSENPVDSLTTSQKTDEKITLPGEFAFGVSFGKTDPQILKYSWMVSADFELFNGSEFRSYTGVSNLVNGYKAQAGGYVIPRFAIGSLNRNNAYWSAVEYRLGAFYEQTPYSVGGTQLSDYGMTFGLGFPVLQRNMAPGEVKVSTINAGLVWGRRGTTDNGLIRENYLNIYIGITLNDKWFIKYKYR